MHYIPIKIDRHQVTGLTNDSRAVQPGNIFFAYKGGSVDGREFIQQAIDRGASLVLYESYISSELNEIHSDKNIPVIPIKNLQAIQSEIAAEFYEFPSRDMTMIGVTGTNGKTSITHFIAQACTEKTGVIGTLGYGFLGNLKKTSLTTPDPLQLQKNIFDLKQAGAKVIAMETSSHALHQHRVDAVEFDIAIYTQLSRDHLDYHQTMENYAAAKELLFQFHSIKHAVINSDDLWGRQFIERYKNQFNVIAYSTREPIFKQTLLAKKITPQQKGFLIEVESPYGNGAFETEVMGRFNVSNLLAVLGALLSMKMSFNDALKQLAKCKTVSGRMQAFEGADAPVVVVDYAHTPDALQKALESLRDHCTGQLWCVFGCGGDRDRGKRSEMAVVAEANADRIIVTNDNPRTELPEQILNDICLGFKNPSAIQVELDRAKAIALAVQSAGNNDIVLIAGKGHEDYQIIGNKTISFSDSREVQRQLDEIVHRRQSD